VGIEVHGDHDGSARLGKVLFVAVAGTQQMRPVEAAGPPVHQPDEEQ
jgi:hypothetical protein